MKTPDKQVVFVSAHYAWDDDPQYALYPSPVGSPGQLLLEMLESAYSKKWAGKVGRAGFIKRFDRRNLQNSRKWNPKRAKESGKAFLDGLSGVGNLIVVGTTALNAMKLPKITPLEWGFHAHSNDVMFEYCWLPNPASEARRYEDPRVREKVGELLLDVYMRGLRE